MRIGQFQVVEFQFSPDKIWSVLTMFVHNEHILYVYMNNMKVCSLELDSSFRYTGHCRLYIMC